MKLLIITQKVDQNDRNLGFFVRWIEAFSRQCEEVTVIANEVGVYEPPENVHVFSLGKEKGTSRLGRLFRYRRFLWRILPRVDGVFFHMCPEYVLAAKFLPKLFGKKSTMWYTHKEVSFRLRAASWLVNKIYTASKESCRLKSAKVEVVGHGIASDAFMRRPAPPQNLRLVTVGRIAPVKDLRTLILGFLEVRKRFSNAEFSIIGEPLTDKDRNYYTELKKEFSSQVHFQGGLPYGTVYMSEPYTAFVHASRTGSMDKAVLEALAAGLPVFTSSEAFSADIPGVIKFTKGNPADLADKIERAFMAGRLVVQEEGRKYVLARHDLNNLVRRIVQFYEK